MGRFIGLSAAMLIVGATFVASAGPAIAESGASGSGTAASAGRVGPAASASVGATMPGGSKLAGSQPMPGKRKAVEDGLRQTGNAPSPAENQRELRSLNQISRQIAPQVAVPAPEVSR